MVMNGHGFFRHFHNSFRDKQPHHEWLTNASSVSINRPSTSNLESPAVTVNA